MQYPIVPVVLGVLIAALQFHGNLLIARNDLAKIFVVGMLTPEDRIKVIYNAEEVTSRFLWSRIFMGLLLYLPVMAWMAWESLSDWTTIAFFAVVLFQVFITKVAWNHNKIVRLEEAKLPREERLQLIELIKKNSFGGRH